MNDAALKSGTTRTQDIVVEEVFPHAPETIWKTLTTRELMGRWLHMTPTGFAPVKGTRFTYQTTPAGAWDGVIHCEVLEVIPNERLVYSWKGGHEGNVGYGSRLDTVVTFTLVQGRSRHAPAPGPFRLRAAEERDGVQEHERRLEEGRAEHRRHRRRAGLREKATLEQYAPEARRSRHATHHRSCRRKNGKPRASSCW